MYSLNSSLYASVFVVPRDIVDKYIKMASFCAVKSLLWILNYRGGAFSVSELAKSIGSSEADVKEALDYWVNEGVLVCDGVEEPAGAALRHSVAPPFFRGDYALRQRSPASFVPVEYHRAALDVTLGDHCIIFHIYLLYQY